MLSSQGCEDTGPNATRAMCPRATIFNSEWCGGETWETAPLQCTSRQRALGSHLQQIAALRKYSKQGKKIRNTL